MRKFIADKIALLIEPATIDAWLVFWCAILIFQQGFLSNDDTYRYVNIYVLFWMKFFVGSMAAGFLALKSFRSHSYSDSIDDKKGVHKVLDSPEDTAAKTAAAEPKQP